MAKVYSRIPAPAPPPRRRNAAATRAAILDSAQQAFARAGYDGVGVREIATGAGVTAMLVNRYFGSKERLFAEVVANTMARPIILTPQTLTAQNPGADMAALLVSLTAAGATPLDGFRILLKSASSARAAEIGREQIEAHHHRTLTAALKGPHAAQRAAVVLSLVAGIQIMRQMISLTALADAPPAVLARILAPLFEHLMTAPAQRRRPPSARRASDLPTPEAGS